MGNSRVYRTIPAVIGAALLAGTAPLAFAALGGDASSVQADLARMKAQDRGSSPSQGYTVQAMQMVSGTIVHEFVSPAGKVFGVSWRGPTIPDLSSLLGTYYEQFSAAAPPPRRGQRHLEVRQPDLVVQSGGHMRAFFGRAYIPSLLPANFDPKDIQ